MSTSKSGLSFLALCAITGAFWAYATVSAVLYAYGFGGALVLAGVESIFAPWFVRVLQYAMLFPFLLASYWLSLRIGWRPWWRAVPLQVLLAIVFTALGQPMLLIAGYAVEGIEALIGDGDPAHLLEALIDYFSTIGVAAATDFFIRYGFGLALVTGAEFYKAARDAQVRATALEREWVSARLQALRMQLSPHALFNLLNLIKGQIGWDPAAAQKSVVMLADLLRRLLRAGDRDFVPLRDELEFGRIYLELQRQRFPDRLQVSLPAVGELADCWLPSLISQPLVENAVAHGLEGHQGLNRVIVDVRKEDEQLVLEVSNDVAPGVAEGAAGVGLTNVRERIAVHFGERGTVTTGITSAGRWLARVELPLLRERPAGPDVARPAEQPLERRA